MLLFQLPCCMLCSCPNNPQGCIKCPLLCQLLGSLLSEAEFSSPGLVTMRPSLSVSGGVSVPDPPGQGQVGAPRLLLCADPAPRLDSCLPQVRITSSTMVKVNLKQIFLKYKNSGSKKSFFTEIQAITEKEDNSRFRFLFSSDQDGYFYKVIIQKAFN
jgi:hypothetical protein